MLGGRGFSPDRKSNLHQVLIPEAQVSLPSLAVKDELHDKHIYSPYGTHMFLICVA
jgi:hypothetical protein